MPDLENQLISLGGAIEWPATPPHLWGGVRRSRTEGVSGWNTRWALAAAAVIVIVATLLAYTPTRDAIAGWLNLHTIVHRTQNPPTPSPLPSGPVGERLGLGTKTTLDGAQGQVGWSIVVPSFLGAPDEVYVKVPPGGPSGGEVTLVYVSRTDIRPTGITGVSVLVTEARGQVNEQYFGKVLGPDVTIEQVSVNGHAGWWISGKPHDFAFTDAQGNFYSDTLRLATNTLIFDDGGTLVRIEGDMTEAQAIEIARSLT
jgi:hypothetical protein